MLVTTDSSLMDCELQEMYSGCDAVSDTNEFSEVDVSSTLNGGT